MVVDVLGQTYNALKNEYLVGTKSQEVIIPPDAERGIALEMTKLLLYLAGSP